MQNVRLKESSPQDRSAKKPPRRCIWLSGEDIRTKKLCGKHMTMLSNMRRNCWKNIMGKMKRWKKITGLNKKRVWERKMRKHK